MKTARSKMGSGKKLIRKTKFTKFRPEVRTRHPSHSKLRRKHQLLPLFPFRSVIRLGSSTELEDDTSHGGKRIELNTIQAIQNSSDKKRMKALFYENNVPTPIWNYLTKIVKPLLADTKVYFSTQIFGADASTMEFPVVVKRDFGSRGEGNTKVNSAKEFRDLVLDLEKKGTTSHYIVEKFYNYNREYRIHVNEKGGFYFLRKMLKSDTPEEERWFRNDKNSVWVLEENIAFDKPSNIKEIEEASVASLKAVGLDFGAVDVRVQSAKSSKGEVRKEAPQFTIIEINSAPSFGEITLQKYLEELPKMLHDKHSKIK